MNKKPLREDDRFLLYCKDAKGFLFSPPALKVCRVVIRPADDSHINNPGFPNVQYAAFEFLQWPSNKPLRSKVGKVYSLYGQKVKLLHAATDKYLYIGEKGPASLEEKEKGNTFRILPSDDSKTSGDIIHVEDKIRLQVSDRDRNDQVVCSSNVLRLSGYDFKTAIDGSDFVLYSQTTEHVDEIEFPLALRGGNMVMFLSREHETYLGTSSEIKVIAKESHGISTFVFKGSDCFWQIEDARFQYNENWIRNTTDVHIKHLPTKLYLAVVRDEITLKSLPPGDHQDHDDTVFRLSEDTSDEEARVSKRRDVIITHKKTSLKLSISSQSVEDHSGFKISLEEDVNQKFWIQAVGNRSVHKISILSSFFITLIDYIKKLENRKDTVSRVILPYIDEFVTWSSKQSEEWPDMFRLQGMDLTVDFLGKKKDMSTEFLQTQLCIISKTYVEHASEESLLYLSKHRLLLKILLEKVGHEIGVEGVLSALVKSWSDEIKKKVEIKKNLVDYACENILNILERKDSAFLDCLSELCLSGTRGKPDRSVQDRLLNEIIVPNHEKGLFITFDTLTGCETDSDEKLLIAQIKFYAAVCKGVNLKSIEKLAKILTFEKALQLSKEPLPNNETFSFAVQSAFYTYLVSTLVDKYTEESGTDLENIWFIYAWKHFLFKSGPPDAFDPVRLSAIAETHDIISDSKDMKKIEEEINECLEKKLNEDICKAGFEELVTQKMSVLECLVSYGFYWNNPGNLIEKLLHILNENVTGQSEEKTEAIFKLKAKVIEVLHMFLKQTYHLSTARTLYDYRYFRPGEVGDHPRDYFPPGRKLKDLMSEDFKEATNDHEKETRRRMKWMLYGDDTDYNILLPGQESNYDYKKLNVYAKSGHVFPSSLRLPSSTDQEEKLVDKLISFLQCNSDTLCLSAALLLFDLFQGETYLFERSKLAYIVSDNSWEKYKVRLNYATYQDKDGKTPVRLLLRLLQGRAEEKRIKKFTSSVIFDCGYWPDKIGSNPADETSMYTAGQNVIFATGVFGVLLNYVIKFSSSDDSEQESLIRLVCKALVRVIRQNLMIKQAVLKKFTDLLEAKLAISCVAHLLTEVLTDNIEACRQLPVFIVRRIFSLAMRGGNPEYNEYITTLVAWMKVRKFPPLLLKNHQEVITLLFFQYFNHHYKENWDPEKIFTLDEEGVAKMLNISYMMAVCAEGELKYAEDVCQRVFTFEKLVSIIARPDILIEQKVPFLLLLKEAYLNTKTKSLEAVVNFGNAKKLWAHFEDAISWITELNGILRRASLEDENFVEFVKIKMRVLFYQHLSYKEWKEHEIWYIYRPKFGTFKDKQIMLSISSFTEVIKSEITISGLLQYIVEGIVPLLSTFCMEYRKCIESFDDELSVQPLKPEHKTILNDIGSAVAELVAGNDKMFLTTESQVQFWKESLCQLKTFTEPNYDPQFELTTDEETPINQEVIEEEALNNEFKVYLENFRFVYQYRKSELDDADLLPKFHGFQEFLTQYFSESCELELLKKELLKKKTIHLENQLNHQLELLKEKTIPLVKLLKILHKLLQQPLDSKDKATYDRLLINTLQSLSGILHRKESQEESSLKSLQNMFVEQKVHSKALIHLDHEDDEVTLQVLGLLKHLTSKANKKAQDCVQKKISSEESLFSKRVYKLLENAIAVFNHPVLRQTEGVKDPSQHQLLVVSDQESVTSDEFVDCEPLMQNRENQMDSPVSQEIPLLGRSLSIIERAGNIEGSFEESMRTACIVLDCISSLCDGQNREMQKFLQGKELTFKEHHIVKKIAILLQVLSEQTENNWTEILMNYPRYLLVIQKAIEALIKACAGSYDNQTAVFQCQITDTINKLLSKFVDDTKNPITDNEERKDLTKKVIELIQILLEETDGQSSVLIISFSNSVDWDIIFDAMFKWKIIGAYHILCLVAHTLGVVCKIGPDNNLTITPSSESLLVSTKWYLNADEKKVWDEFEKLTCHIELMYKPIEEKEDHILTHVYFPFDPVHSLTEGEKAKVNNGILEETREQTLTEFTKWTESIRLNARHKHNIFQKYKWIYYPIYELSWPRQYVLSFLTILLNLLVLSVFKVPESDTTTATNSSIILKPDTPLWYSSYLLFILGGLHLVLGIFMMLEYYIKGYPLISKHCLPYDWFKEQIYDFKQWVTRQEFLKKICPLSWSERNNSSTTKSARYFGIDLLGFRSIYHVLFVVCSILALGSSGYFYCFCLIYVTLNIDVVQYLLTALKKSAVQLIYVAIIGEVLILMFSVIAFAFLHDYFETQNNLFCSTLWECFVTVTYEGWLSTIGAALPFTKGEQSATSFSMYSLRAFFFDIPFYVIISVIARSLITAILISKFSELRGERDKIRSKMFKFCFICGHDSEAFEDGFKKHVQEDHNKWNYIYYMIYLDMKHQTNPNDMTAIEKQVYMPIGDRSNIKHFPKREAKVLKAK